MQRIMADFNWLKVVCLAGAAPLLAAGTDGAAAMARPNILWLTVEDMSPTLGCWGDSYARTPNIDALAKQSVRYTNVFATAPVCSPARSCLITGCYATSLGTQRLRSRFPIPRRMRGFPSLLRKIGYYCTNNVKTDYNTANQPEIIAASWDACDGEAHWRGRSAGQPFFAVFNDMTSHQSRTMAWPYEQFQRKVQSRLSSEAIHDPARAPIPPYYPDTPVICRTVARYYDCITMMDKNVGALLRQLERDELADDTIVFFYSDHGSGMPRHKRTLLDTGMRVPLLIRFPRKFQHLAPAAPGETTDRLISFVDFPPTVLSLCGVAVPESMQGKAFLGSRRERPRSFVHGARDRVDEAFDLARSVHNGRFLYIHNFMPHLSYHQPSYWPEQGEIRDEISRFVRQSPEKVTAPMRHYAGPRRPREELYDTQADPLNLHNLAASAEHRETLEAMRAELWRWIRNSHDFGFLPEAEAWRRCRGDTPWNVSQDPARYPLARLFQVASLVGGGPKNLPELQQALGSDEPGARYWAAVGLAALGADAAPARAELAAAVRDPSPDVRIEAANALALAGNVDQGLPVLVAELASEDPNVVLHAARAIELLGARARSAAGAMKAALQRASGPGDSNMFIQFAAKGFFKALETRGKTRTSGGATGAAR